MFPRRKRIAREAFPTALKSGRRFSSPHFSIVISNEASGYAVIVPKKVARLAVTRHRIKRRVLAALRSLPLPPSLIVFPKTSVNSVSYQEVQRELATLLSKNN
ncbi:MAG: ribonuclease P protein component [Bacteroidetes bacterium]|nr:MAG: ribonuclease P protein component [Bacteroidota bacterium]